MGIFNFFKNKYIEFEKVGEDIQYFGPDGSIIPGDSIEITYKPKLGLRFLFPEIKEQVYFWEGKYTYLNDYLKLKDIEGNKICGECLEKILILNKSEISFSRRAVTKGGKLSPPKGEIKKVSLDKILYLRKLSDYAVTPSETV
ncbi:hypothetical protein COY26_01150 [Candidatus Woesearchaeota archaeon CG_4_10_14_0_2_um_filter_33_10]|nr:MAG: hypothetical protein AUJ83_03870 [Candidatus Woesearchaeota archaeon CG1_02_33_12]PIN77833.1 MAG: hypothetical protein COV14_05060 [Candidatus Woesearchaeota archaeon CG10_big_fil_rev_8_21_14_0_10_33_12]PIU72981.1 MAG: hypothetical protein COS79_00485 [Candidatus Woesearchaeota archaeon CG06_land_8_20_14_3_00_33_13]PIZ53683.1 MAG: hypothetical protein COY26_01150 [Candidatus Woesearchaeota archaeon CG_4_10_14_0_2_um_filter_33_10]